MFDQMKKYVATPEQWQEAVNDYFPTFDLIIKRPVQELSVEQFKDIVRN